MSLDDAVRSSVDRAVHHEPTDGVLLLQRVTARESRGSRRRWWTAAAVLASVAGVLAAAVVVPGLLGEDPPDVAAPRLPTEVPPGSQAVSWHGVQLFVPASWKLYDLNCSAPQSDTVVVPGVRHDCLANEPAGLTVVEFQPGSDPVPGARAVEVSGVAGLRGTVPVSVSGFSVRPSPTQTADELGARAVLALPDLDVTVSVRSPDSAKAEALLDTAQVIDVDALGCLTRLPGTTPPEPDVPGAADRVIPGEPVRVALCGYGDLRLEHSGTLGPQQVRELQAALDAAPEGTSPSRVGITGGAESCPAYDRAPLVIQAQYADGGRLQVFTRLNSCTGPDPDNGARRVVLPNNSETVLDLYTAIDHW